MQRMGKHTVWKNIWCLVALLLLCTQAHAGTLILCPDVEYTHYTRGGMVHGHLIPPGALVLTCPRSNATWSLIIVGCAAYRVSTDRMGSGNVRLTC